jgi:hypothetical protein
MPPVSRYVQLARCRDDTVPTAIFLRGTYLPDKDPYKQGSMRQSQQLFTCHKVLLQHVSADA